MRRLGFSLLLAFALWTLPSRSEAGTLRFGVGANYWFVEQLYMDGTIGYEATLLPILSVGGRGGVLLVTGPARAGFESDLIVRIMPLPSFYIEGLAGPWFLINSGDTIRAHAAVGLGIQVGPIGFGVEAGYLSPDAILGARLALRL